MRRIIWGRSTIHTHRLRLILAIFDRLLTVPSGAWLPISSQVLCIFGSSCSHPRSPTCCQSRLRWVADRLKACRYPNKWHASKMPEATAFGGMGQFQARLQRRCLSKALSHLTRATIQARSQVFRPWRWRQIVLRLVCGADFLSYQRMFGDPV